RGGAAPNDECVATKTISSTCRRLTACVSDWSASAPVSSTRFAPSCWSAALPCGKGSASCVSSCRACWPRALTLCYREWCASSKTWPATDPGSMSASRDCRARLRLSRVGRRLRAADECAGGSDDHLQRGWQRSALEMRPQRPRLRRLAGLVPKQISTRNRTILGEISKRGIRYLHTIRAGGLGRHPLGSKLINPTRPCGKGGRITDWQGFPSIFCRGSASAHLISLDLRSSARKWVGVFGNGALHISARIVVRTSLTLN